MKAFYSTLQKSCRSFFGNFKSVVLIVFIDILFFLSVGLAYSKLWENAMGHVDAVLTIMDASLGGLTGEQTREQVMALMANHSEFMMHYKMISYYVLALFVSILVFWCIFQGINWFLTHKILEKEKQNFWRFLGRFSALSLLWWVFFVLILTLAMKLSMSASSAVIPLVSGAAVKLLIYILLFVLFCLAYTSYALVQKHGTRQLLKETLKKFYAKYQLLVPAYIFMLIVLIGEYLIFVKSIAFGWTIPLLFAIIIMLPTIAWTRIYAVKVLEN